MDNVVPITKFARPPVDVAAGQAAALAPPGLGSLPANFQPLQSGDRGLLVRGLQERLDAWGFAPGKIDGDFGPKTKAAVEALQRKLGVMVTGVFDAVTALLVNVDLEKANSILRANANRLIEPTPSDSPTTKPGIPVVVWIGLGLLGVMVLSAFSSNRKMQLAGGDDYLDQDDGLSPLTTKEARQVGSGVIQDILTAGVHHNEIAKAAGVPASMVDRWAQGSETIPSRKLLKLMPLLSKIVGEPEFDADEFIEDAEIFED